MRATAFTILFILVSVFSKAQSSEHSFTTIGIVTDIYHGDIIGLDRLELSINGGAKNLTFYFDAQYKDSVYLNKKVKINYTISESLKEVDMYANDTSVYYDRKNPKDISKALKVEGILDIYDYGCAMPGTYYIKSADSSVTRFSHYVEGKYQKPHEFKNVTVYYTIKETNFVGELSFINKKETEKEIPYTYICYVPKGKPEVPAVVWIGFNDFGKGAKIKYRNEDKIINLAFDKEEFICDSCMYPTSYIYFSEISNGKIIGEYKLIHAGNVNDLKHTRFSDNKNYIYYNDEKEKPFALTPCF